MANRRKHESNYSVVRKMIDKRTKRKTRIVSVSGGTTSITSSGTNTGGVGNIIPILAYGVTGTETLLTHVDVGYIWADSPIYLQYDPVTNSAEIRYANEVVTITTTSGTVTLTDAQAQHDIIRVTSALVGNLIIEVPEELNAGARFVLNESTGAFTVSLRFGAGGTPTEVEQGTTSIVGDGWGFSMAGGGFPLSVWGLGPTLEDLVPTSFYGQGSVQFWDDDGAAYAKVEESLNPAFWMW